MVGEGRVKAVIEGGDKDMGKAQNVEESIWGRGKKNVRVAKKERKKIEAAGEGREREGMGWRRGVERVRMWWGRGMRGSRSHEFFNKTSNQKGFSSLTLIY